MDAHPSPRRTVWEHTYAQIHPIATDLGRLPRLSDGVEPRLVNWIANQRRAQKLRPEQRALLEQLPGWSWDPKQDAWLERAEELRGFITTHGRPPREREATESALAHWLSRQLVADRNGRLSADRRTVLDYVLRRRAAPGLK